MMKTYAFIAVCVVIASCTREPASKPQPLPRNDLLTGTWESEELTVRLHSAYGNPDSSAIIKANRRNWVEVMGLLPIQTTFNPDNTYSAIYREADGTIRSETSGYFELLGRDSLIIHRLKPSAETIRHIWVQKNDSVYGFSGLVDYDRDGLTDDELFSLNRRIHR